MRVVVTGVGMLAPAEDRAPFDPDQYLEPSRSRRLDRLSQLGVASAQLARRDADLELARAHPDPHTGVAFGTAYGCQQTALRYADKLVGQGPTFTNPIDFPDSVDGAPAAHIAMELGLQGPSSTHVDAEASGALALTHAWLALRAGRAERMLVASGDVATSHLDGARRRLGLPRAVDYQAACVVLEPEVLAERRGVRIYAELAAVAQACDPRAAPYRLADERLVRQVETQALARAGLPPGAAPDRNPQARVPGWSGNPAA